MHGRRFGHGGGELVLYESFPARKGARLSTICLLLWCIAISSLLFFLSCSLQKKIAARDEASLAHERAALGHAQELEGRVAAFDAKEKKALRVGERMAEALGKLAEVVGRVLRGWGGNRLWLTQTQNKSPFLPLCQPSPVSRAGTGRAGIGSGWEGVQAGGAAC